MEICAIVRIAVYVYCGVITKTDFFFNGTINRIFPGLLCILNKIFTSPLGSECKESKCQKAGAFPALTQSECSHVERESRF